MRKPVENTDESGPAIALVLTCFLVFPCASPAMFLLGIWALRRQRKTRGETWILTVSTVGHLLWSLIVIPGGAYLAIEATRAVFHQPPLFDPVSKMKE